mmetsp:Transcript_21796/g.32455  ORF Transcript_21796/g.32455 Transcript_21796/m.32455 type:complete len:657 (+) Transcript_21796:38-2008(+)
MIGTAITHVGLGNFSRAHLAYFTNNFLRKAGPSEWGICAVDRDSPRSQALEGYLKKNDFHYKLIMKGKEAKEEHDIQSIRNFINLGQHPENALKQLCEPTTRICTLTITEKGYYCDVNTGELFVDNPEIQHDLKNPDKPKSTIGLICSALNYRRKNGMEPFTVLSCDNLPGNGHITENAVTQFAELLDPELSNYIEGVTFPNSMVDRITPQTASAEDPIVSEDFAQWVVEDKFCNGRPYWEILDDILLVEDVIPYEKMKVRLLNGSHSALSYLSYLAGHRDVDQALASTDVKEFVKMYLAEVAVNVPEVPGIDIVWYQQKLVERFSNPNIKDQVQRLAEDGSSKLQTTMLPVIREKGELGQPMPIMALAVAGWIRYMAGVDDFGKEIKIVDPLADKLTPIAQKVLSTRDTRPFLLAVFGDDILEVRGFSTQVQAWYERLLKEGVWRVLDSLDEFAFGFASTSSTEFQTPTVESAFSGKTLDQLISLSYNDLQSMFDTYDKDQSGFLDLEEVTTLLKDFIEKIKETLPTSDFDKVLGIKVKTEEEKKEVVDNIIGSLPDVENEYAVKLVLARLDANGDGLISPEEFVERFREVVQINYQTVKNELTVVESKTTAVDLAPRTFAGSWRHMEGWVNRVRNYARERGKKLQRSLSSSTEK